MALVLKESKEIHDYQPILEGLINDFGYSYYASILAYCGIIDKEVEHCYWRKWLIRSGGKTVGMCGLYSMENDENELWIGWFGILPGFRGNGIGQDVLEQMIMHAKTIGCKRILSYVITEKALNFYYKSGFKRICSVKEYIRKHPDYKDNFDRKTDHIIQLDIHANRH